MRENTDQKNSKYGHSLRSVSHKINLLIKQALPTFRNVDKIIFKLKTFKIKGDSDIITNANSRCAGEFTL